MLPAKLIKAIRNRFSKVKTVDSIYIFGSSIRNYVRKESDVDLAFVVNDKNLKINLIYSLLQDLHFPRDIDISLISESSSPLFLYQIISTGMRIYTRNEDRANAFEAYILRIYYDNAHMRDIYFSYLKQKFSHAS